jgi:hypothetical protein
MAVKWNFPFRKRNRRCPANCWDPLATDLGGEPSHDSDIRNEDDCANESTGDCAAACSALIVPFFDVIIGRGHIILGSNEKSARSHFLGEQLSLDRVLALDDEVLHELQFPSLLPDTSTW